MYLIFLGIAIGLLILAIGRVVSKSRYLYGRANLTDIELEELFASSGVPLSRRAFTTVILIGKCYGVSYAKLRPTDYFKGGLAEIDSWRGGVGSMRFQHFLTMEFGSSSPINKRTISIGGLIRELGI